MCTTLTASCHNFLLRLALFCYSRQMDKVVMARLRAGWSPSGPSYGERIARVLRGGSFIGMAGVFDRDAGMQRVWVDYVYGSVQSARWDAARVAAAAAAAIDGWPSVWVEWAEEGGDYKAPTVREVERMAGKLMQTR